MRRVWIIVAIALLAGTGCASKKGAYNYVPRDQGLAIDMEAQDMEGTESRASIHHGMARMFLKQGRYDDAENQARLSLGIAPEDPEGHFILGQVYRQQRRVELAEAAFRRAIELDKKFADAHNELAVTYDLLGKHPDAIVHYDIALKRSPENPEYLANKGFSLIMQRKYDEAEQVLTLGLEVDPYHARLHNNLGLAYGLRGNYNRAFVEFKQGGSLCMAYYHLGFTYEKRGDLHNAYQVYGKALEIDPGMTKAREKLEEIAGHLAKR